MSNISSSTFYFDFVDPLSYLQELELRPVEAELGGSVERVGFELTPPPEPITTTADARWADRWQHARASGVQLASPALVPWSRKAHELHAHAREYGIADAMRLSIFEAYFKRGEDIGRVDRLVAIAVSHGLDRTAVKAALDVDRHEEEVATARASALAAGVADVPTLAVGGIATPGIPTTDLAVPVTAVPGTAVPGTAARGVGAHLVRGFHNRQALLTLLRT